MAKSHIRALYQAVNSNLHLFHDDADTWVVDILSRHTEDPRAAEKAIRAYGKPLDGPEKKRLGFAANAIIGSGYVAALDPRGRTLLEEREWGQASAVVAYRVLFGVSQQQELDNQKKTAAELGVKIFVKWMSTEDDRACEHCRSRNGKQWLLDEFRLEDHVCTSAWCRCALAFDFVDTPAARHLELAREGVAPSTASVTTQKTAAVQVTVTPPVPAAATDEHFLVGFFKVAQRSYPWRFLTWVGVVFGAIMALAMLPQPTCSIWGALAILATFAIPALIFSIPNRSWFYLLIRAFLAFFILIIITSLTLTSR